MLETQRFEFMARCCLINRVLAHCRVIFAWAVMPLAAVPGETIIGCGCSGHFEAVCHCQSCRDECREHRAPAIGSCCCHGAPGGAQTCRQSSSADGRAQSKSHQCIKIVLHKGDLLLVPSLHGSDQHQFATILPLSFGAPGKIQLPTGRRAFAIDSGPPPRDVVITLRRLVI
jgi:hypothetical protein